MPPLPLTEYLDAVGLDPRPPSRDALDELVRTHVATFAFASVGVRLGDDLPLAPAAVHDRLITRRRGGYCFEHNLVMHDVLAGLGYDVTLYLARVLVSGDPHPGLTHRVTTVELDGARYLVDVGFGPQGPDAAVPFDGSAVGPPWRRVRLVRTGDSQWTTFSGPPDAPAPMYRFDEAQYGDADCELGHFYSHRHPDSHFVRTVVASTLHGDETRSLRNRDYWRIGAAGPRTHVVTDAADLRRILADDFGLTVSQAECVRLLDSLAEGERASD